MPIAAPKIDPRRYGDLVAETQALAQAATDWRPPADGSLDAGSALIRIFARFAELVVERLNQVPEKHFLAYLDLIGTQLLPPQPARVPLTFLLAAGSQEETLVPVAAGTRVAAPPAEGASKEVLFETERELVPTTAQIKAVFVREPARDRYADYTQQATNDEEIFQPFRGSERVEHAIYLALDRYFALPEAKDLTLILDSPTVESLAALPIRWSYWDGEGWRSLENVVSAIEDGRWVISISQLPAPAPRPIQQTTACWLQAKLALALPRGEEDAIEPDAHAGQIERRGLSPDAALVADSPLDLGAAFFPFGTHEALATFYLNAEEAFSRTGAQVSLRLVLAENGSASPDLVLVWEYHDGQGWQVLGSSSPSAETEGPTGYGFRDTTRALTLPQGSVEFQVPAGWAEQVREGKLGRWLRVRVVTGDYGTGEDFQPPQIAALEIDYDWRLPAIARIQARVTLNQEGLVPDLGFGNGGALDLSKDFYPFGERPRFNDTLYLASQEVFSKPGATVTVFTQLSESLPPPQAFGDLQVTWEAWDGVRWQPLKVQGDPVGQGVERFLRSGRVTFELPVAPRARVENGVHSYWVRARITAGGYGQEARYGQAPEDLFKASPEYASDLDASRLPDGLRADFREQAAIVLGPDVTVAVKARGNRWLVVDQATVYSIAKVSQFALQVTLQSTGYRLVPATFAPPSLASLKLAYSYSPGSQSLDRCLAQNDFACHDHTATAAEEHSTFLPFTPLRDSRPSLYVGFDHPFANRPMTLYVRVEPSPYDPATSGLALSEEPATLIWEFMGSEDWTRLSVEDETESLTERGLVRFLGPQDPVRREDFGLSLYWLRVRWVQGDYRVEPLVRHLLTNTTWAIQAATVANELLGSSNGEPNQVFKTARTPLLTGPRIEVREPGLPSATELAAIERAEGGDALSVKLDASGRPLEVWVRWHQVPDFHGSGPLDRHYVLDYLAGTVRFGDGQRGRVPARGRNNVRASYRTGGGPDGNRPAGAVNQLKSTLPYVDGVVNLEPSLGGVAAESLDQVKERGPRQIRHRGRAVAAQDFEDLALEASPEVARVRAIVPRFDPLSMEWLDPLSDPGAEPGQAEVTGAGRVGLILVPASDDVKPTSSLALIRRVEDYVLARCAPTLDLWIGGPDWVEVTIEAELVPVSFEAASNLDQAALVALRAFLHPLTGGADGRGWAFGRRPHRSDLYALLESIDGVDHVRHLQVRTDPEDLGEVQADRFLVYSGAHKIHLAMPVEER